MSSVDTLLVRHEVAHVIHADRHKGDAQYCASDQQIAEKILELFAERGWIVQQSKRAET